MDKLRVFVYVDGSNFYNHLKDNYGKIPVDYFELASLMCKPEEVIKKICYFNAPVSQQDNPNGYVGQQTFFAKLRINPLIKIYLGSLRKRFYKKINVNCPQCGPQEANVIQCPGCMKNIDLLTCTRYSEKGVDVRLAITMLLDALENKYDVAFLMSSDADFVPAIEHIVKKLKKDVIYCHFPKPKTNALHMACTESRLLEKSYFEQAAVFHI